MTFMALQASSTLPMGLPSPRRFKEMRTFFIIVTNSTAAYIYLSEFV